MKTETKLATWQQGMVTIGVGLLAVAGWGFWSAYRAITPKDQMMSLFMGAFPLLGAIACFAIAGKHHIAAANEPEPLPSADLTGRVPCPSCRESVDPQATVCPHCQRNIFALTPRKNAERQVVAFLVTFGVLWALGYFAVHFAY